jgi:SAM-dependent methyltransferase
MDSKERFSNRVDDYVRYRPSYPPSLVDALSRLGHLGPDRVVADVGSGTGIFTRLLLERGARVIAIEPNAAMRAAAERDLAEHPRFESLDGCAEATGLAAGSIDLVTVAQAFHWFDPVRARGEFVRILRRRGHVALVWNRRWETPFNRDYDALLDRFSPDYQDLREKDRAAEPKIRAFFAPSSPTCLSFENEQRLDAAGLAGRLTSSSYAPPVGSPLHKPMLNELVSIFRTHAQGGEVVIEYETVLWCGQLA